MSQDISLGNVAIFREQITRVWERAARRLTAARLVFLQRRRNRVCKRLPSSAVDCHQKCRQAQAEKWLQPTAEPGISAILVTYLTLLLMMFERRLSSTKRWVSGYTNLDFCLPLAMRSVWCTCYEYIWSCSALPPICLSRWICAIYVFSSGGPHGRTERVTSETTNDMVGKILFPGCEKIRLNKSLKAISVNERRVLSLFPCRKKLAAPHELVWVGENGETMIIVREMSSEVCHCDQRLPLPVNFKGIELGRRCW